MYLVSRLLKTKSQKLIISVLKAEEYLSDDSTFEYLSHPPGSVARALDLSRLRDK